MGKTILTELPPLKVNLFPLPIEIVVFEVYLTPKSHTHISAPIISQSIK